MLDPRACSYHQLIDPVANAGATTEETLDTIGFRHATVIVGLGNAASSTTTLKMTESDASDMSGSADISGANFDGGTDVDGDTLALPGSSDDDKLDIFEIHLGPNRKRYLRPEVVVGGSTSAVYCIAILSDGANAPANTSAGKGAESAASIFGVIQV